MQRPTGWRVNPQAMASLNARLEYDGAPALGRTVDADTWLTPRYILRELGEFDLDPCAAEENPTWVAKRFYTKERDGLNQIWIGRVFMNPPFSNTVPWLERHAVHGHGISLVPASVESKVWRSDVWPNARGILLLHGRTRFANPDGSITTGRPLRSIALIAWGAADLYFLEQSKLAGVLLKQWGLR